MFDNSVGLDAVIVCYIVIFMCLFLLFAVIGGLFVGCCGFCVCEWSVD